MEGGYAPDLRSFENLQPSSLKTSVGDTSAQTGSPQAALGEEQDEDRGYLRSLTDDQCLLTCCFARGFALQSREWCE